MSDSVVRPPSFRGSKELFVIAIDIGTTYSGYAISLSSDRYKIDVICENDPNADAVPGCAPRGKIPTALLLEPDGTFHSFGYKALSDYNSQLDEDPDAEMTWMYFDRFKMDLHCKSDFTRSVKATARNGKQLDLILVFSHVMKYFKSTAVSRLNLLSKTDVSPHDAKWVVTVPAIWNDGAKQIMREAAYKAGLASPENPERIAVALEPEAAAVYCKFSNVITADSAEEQDVSVAYERGTRYLLADMGGGTVDVTVHIIGNDDKIRELHHATGGAWGGTYVDLEFVCLLERIFGKDVMERFQSQCPCEWVNFISKFESAKRTAAPGKKMRVLLPFQFIQFVISEGKTVSKLINDFQNENVKFFRGSLALAYPEAEKLFQPVFNNITCHLKSILEKVENIKYVILVGGFATLPLLQQRIREQLSSVRVLAVRESSLAVVMGAVLFGHDSSLIATRRLKYTYGIAYRSDFVEKLDPDDYCVFNDEGRKKCRNRFKIFVEKNDEVDIDQEVAHQFSPSSADITYLRVRVFSSENPSPRYTTDEGVKEVARMILPMPNTEGGKSRKAIITMRFGKIEIEVLSRDSTSDTAVQRVVDLNFLGQSE